MSALPVRLHLANHDQPALIDADDLHKVHTVGFACGLFWTGTIGSVTWRAAKKNHTAYVVASLGGLLELRLHRVVMDASAIQIIDHIDHDGLNNQRGNLRFVTPEQNSSNRVKKTPTTSRFKGVAKHNQTGLWEAYIRVQRTKKHLGLFVTETDAAAAYNVAAREVFGDHAYLNDMAPAT